MSATKKYFAVLMIISLLLVVFGGIYIYNKIYDYLIDNLGNEAVTIAKATSSLINSSSKMFFSEDNISPEFYFGVKQHLKNTLNHNKNLLYIYYLHNNQGTFQKVADTKDTPINIDYLIGEIAYNTYILNKESFDQHLQVNKGNTFLNAFAPVEINKKIIGLVGVEINAQKIINETKRIKSYLLINGLLLSLLLTFTNYKFAQIIVSRNQLYLGSINSLLDSINAKDNYTLQHSLNVSYYSSLIAKEFEFSKRDVISIENIAKLHDIGKIGIKDAILNKVGPLNDIEYETIKQHPLIGAQILSHLSKSNQFLSIVRSHHERFDGNGYPFGLKGEDIPLEARIVSVADTFDAMTTKRPYRPALSYQVAVQELVKNKGSQFDPEVVDAFIRILDKNNLIGIMR
ncbi:MAG: HD-GYP domain-containing protein [Bacillota bacterium]